MSNINNNINNTIGGSLSGVTNSLTITNPSNTGSSSALVQVTTGGASSGNPFTTYTVTSVSSFSQGINNAATGTPYTLSASTALGTTNVSTVSTTGAWNYPKQCSFTAYIGSVDSNVTGNGTIYTLGTTVAFTKKFDQGTNFNTNGTFTAPVTGKYHFDYGLRVTGESALATTITGTIVTTARSYQQTFIRPASSSDLMTQFSCLADMTLGDTATFTAQVSGMASDAADIFGGAVLNTYVSGFLVC